MSVRLFLYRNDKDKEPGLSLVWNLPWNKSMRTKKTRLIFLTFSLPTYCSKILLTQVIAFELLVAWYILKLHILSWRFWPVLVSYIYFPSYFSWLFTSFVFLIFPTTLVEGLNYVLNETDCHFWFGRQVHEIPQCYSSLLSILNDTWACDSQSFQTLHQEC